MKRIFIYIHKQNCVLPILQCFYTHAKKHNSMQVGSPRVSCVMDCLVLTGNFCVSEMVISNSGCRVLFTLTLLSTHVLYFHTILVFHRCRLGSEQIETCGPDSHRQHSYKLCSAFNIFSKLTEFSRLKCLFLCCGNLES